MLSPTFVDKIDEGTHLFTVPDGLDDFYICPRAATFKAKHDLDRDTLRTMNRLYSNNQEFPTISTSHPSWSDLGIKSQGVQARLVPLKIIDEHLGTHYREDALHRQVSTLASKHKDCTVTLLQEGQVAVVCQVHEFRCELPLVKAIHQPWFCSKCWDTLQRIQKDLAQPGAFPLFLHPKGDYSKDFPYVLRCSMHAVPFFFAATFAVGPCFGCQHSVSAPTQSQWTKERNVWLTAQAVFATPEFQNLRTAAENVPGAKAYITTFSNFLGLQGEAPQHCIMAVVLAANHFDVPQSHLEACHSFVSEVQHRVDFLFSSVGQPFDHALAVLDGASRFTRLLKSQNPNIAIHVVFYIACHNLSEDHIYWTDSYYATASFDYGEGTMLPSKKQFVNHPRVALLNPLIHLRQAAVGMTGFLDMCHAVNFFDMLTDHISLRTIAACGRNENAHGFNGVGVVLCALRDTLTRNAGPLTYPRLLPLLKQCFQHTATAQTPFFVEERSMHEADVDSTVFHGVWHTRTQWQMPACSHSPTKQLMPVPEQSSAAKRQRTQ